jgi:hypothetical protein
MKGTALAPLQHLRPTLGSTRTSAMARAVVVLIGATLALSILSTLSACGTQQPGAAAIVNGTAISEKDVQTVTAQFNAIPRAAKAAPRDVLYNLILAPYVLAEADRAGKSISEAQARKVIGPVANLSPATMDFIRMQLEIPTLSKASETSILATVARAKITVNPRYGTFDKQAGVLPTSPNWIKPTASPVAR